MDEKSDLDEKLTKLGEFIESSPIFAGLPSDEKERLVRQKSCMGEYSEILAERIAAFGLSVDELNGVRHFTFGPAIEAAKSGKRIARDGWNGKGMFVYYVPANSYPAQTGVAKAHFGENAMVPYNAYLALKGVDGTVNTWVPSVNDALATDWQVLD
ncbi:hypothetical protein GCM10023212_05390 [Luteolibacter yonseiensis]